MTSETPEFQLHKKGRLFILGAGFSRSAGIPMMDSLLNEVMKLFRFECPGVYARIRNYGQVAFGLGDTEPDWKKLNFSDLCTFIDYVELREQGGDEQWSNEGCRERLALKHYLGKTIAQLTPTDGQVPELYRQFALQLRTEDVVITFNWDTLLEHALRAVGKPYTYGTRENDVLLIKMHGSINWRRTKIQDLLFPEQLPWSPLELPGVERSGLQYSNELLHFRSWQDAKPIGGEVSPFLVLPGYGKAKDVGYIAPLWYKPEGYFYCQGSVYVIGLSLSQDDFFVRSLLLHNLSEPDSPRRVTIINPDPAAKDSYSFALNVPGTQLRQEPFGLAHVDEMKHRD